MVSPGSLNRLTNCFVCILPDTYLSGELAETLEIFADFFSSGFFWH